MIISNWSETNRMLLHAPFVTKKFIRKEGNPFVNSVELLRHNCISYSPGRCNQLQSVGIVLQYAVEPRLSNDSVLDQKIRDFCVSDVERKFGSRPNQKKPSEHKRAMMLHMSAFFAKSLL